LAERRVKTAPKTAPKTAMVLAAGLGKRMRPLTDGLPKPLIEVAGQPLICHALDRLAAAGVERAVVNLHYKGAMIEAALFDRTLPRIEYSREAELLETGGAVRKALPQLGECFYALNGDIFWLDGLAPSLHRLTEFFDQSRMDAALLMQRTVSAVGYDGIGDYFLDPMGVPRRRGEREIAPYIFAGIQILHRRLFDGIDDTVFSLKKLYDRAEDAGRLGAIVHDGEWFHVGTPDGLDATRARLAAHRIER
jgi:N-acetyl-alpha-D-muramate 1-phosphate uridylyltransferase